MSSGVTITPEEITALIETVGSLAAHGLDAYSQAKALAAKAGVTKEDLDAADARFIKPYTDPLAPKP